MPNGVSANGDSITAVTATVVDPNGLTPRQRAWSGLTIIGTLLVLSIGFATWAKSMLTQLIDNANAQAALERQRSDEREARSREHGDKAVEVLRIETAKQTDRIEKAIHTQTLMIDRNLQRSIELQRELVKKTPTAHSTDPP